MAKQRLTFDEFLEETVGGFGRYQQTRLCGCLLLATMSGVLLCSFAFTLYVPNHRCAIPGLPNDTYASQNEAHLLLLNESIPQDPKYSTCYLWRSSTSTDENNNSRSTGVGAESVEDVTRLVKCDRWVYDKSEMELTIIEALDLVCDRVEFRAHANMVIMAGQVVGALVLATFTDIFGRKGVMNVMLPVTCLAYFANAFCLVSIPLLLLVRFIVGVCAATLFFSANLLCLEISSLSKRNLINVLSNGFWTVGAFMVAGIAFIWPNFPNIYIAIALPTVLYFFLMWFLDESPRWLLIKGRVEEGKRILKKIAETNNRNFSEAKFQTLLKTEFSASIQNYNELEINRNEKDQLSFQENPINPNRTLTNHEHRHCPNEDNEHLERFLPDKQLGGLSSLHSNSGKGGFFLLIRNRRMMAICCITSFEWLVVGMVYYAIMFNVSNLPGSLYVNFILLCSVDLLNNFFVYFIVNRAGRKRTYAFFMLLSVCGCFACILPTFLMEEGSKGQVVALNVLSLMGRVGVASGFTVIILYTAELFPTPLRMTCNGISNIASKVGSALAPYISDLGLLLGGPAAKVLPLLICGALGVAGICLLTTLPETANRDLQDNVNSKHEADEEAGKKEGGLKNC